MIKYNWRDDLITKKQKIYIEETATLLIEAINHMDSDLRIIAFFLVLLVIGKIAKTLIDWMS